MGYLPYVLAVSLVLLLALSAVLWGLLSAQGEKEEHQKIHIGVTGSLDDRLLQMGLSALQTFDETKYSVVLSQYSQDEAHAALARGDIAAYVVMPEDFIQQALYGKIHPVRFVTTTDTVDIVTLFKDEILEIITDLLVASQKGIYGIGNALKDNGHGDLANEHINKISYEYLYLVLDRTDGVVVEELGIGETLTTAEYYVCSIAIFFLLLMGIPFAGLYCKKNASLSALLHSRGVGSFGQLVGEFLPFFLGMVFLVLVLLGGLSLSGRVLPMPDMLRDAFRRGGISFFSLLLPLLMITAFTYGIFELSDNMIGGLLTHFFLTVSLCYVSGCFYPIYAFPEAVQKVAAAAPVCILREYMARGFTGSSSPDSTVMLLCYTGLFLGIALLSKRHKHVRNGGR